MCKRATSIANATLPSASNGGRVCWRASVGDTVCTAEGRADGHTVGTTEGEAVARAVGEADGLAEGADDGEGVRRPVGETEWSEPQGMPVSSSWAGLWEAPAPVRVRRKWRTESPFLQRNI